MKCEAPSTEEWTGTDTRDDVGLGIAQYFGAGGRGTALERRTGFALGPFYCTTDLDFAAPTNRALIGQTGALFTGPSADPNIVSFLNVEAGEVALILTGFRFRYLGPLDPTNIAEVMAPVDGARLTYRRRGQSNATWSGTWSSQTLATRYTQTAAADAATLEAAPYQFAYPVLVDGKEDVLQLQCDQITGVANLPVLVELHGAAFNRSDIIGRKPSQVLAASALWTAFAARWGFIAADQVRRMLARGMKAGA
jgi:hypothetical protein